MLTDERIWELIEHHTGIVTQRRPMAIVSAIRAIIAEAVVECQKPNVDVKACWSAYIEENTEPVNDLHCEGCGKPSSSLTTWTIKDDESERIIWLCGSCQSVEFSH